MNYILTQYHKYPLCKFVDVIKQAYQAEFGIGHVLGEKARGYLLSEASSVTPKQGDLFDVISPRFARVHLAEYLRRGYSLELLYFLMKRAEPLSGTREGMLARLSELEKMVENHSLDFTMASVRRTIGEYKAKGCPAVHHSSGYKVNYRPHYRLTLADHARYLPVIAEVFDRLERQNVVFVAIDGMCGSGKTHLANLLADLWETEIIRADDFFLPKNMRSEERLNQAGGNVHYERLAETLAQAAVHRPFDYLRYDCGLDCFTQKSFSPKRLVIVEGTYSLRAELQRYYDVQVQLNVSKLTQTGRLIAREGMDGYNAFRDRWIPLENRYFQSLNENADRIVIDTTDF